MTDAETNSAYLQRQLDQAYPETDPREIASLKRIAKRCWRYLLTFVGDECIKETPARAKCGKWASYRFDAFDIWCVEVGVHGKGLWSINFRLKDAPELCRFLINPLESLERDLNELEQLVSTDPYDKNTIQPPKMRIKRKRKLRARIQDTIHKLHKDTLQITDEGDRYRRGRVELYRQQPGPKGAYDGFMALGLYKARLQFKKASEPFLHRLAESFARRRIRFQYLREHQRKRIIDTPKLARPSASKIRAKPAVPAAGEIEALKSMMKKITVSQGGLQDQPTAGFPLPPPRYTNGNFQCPYCRLYFHPREAENGHWSKHVMHDFEPYFCFFEECSAPFDVPNTFEGLMTHMQSHADMKYHVKMPDGKVLTFDEEGYDALYKELPTELLAVMKSHSLRKAAFTFKSCPFCGEFPDHIEKRFPDRDSLKCQVEMQRHVKQHMHEVALFFPPFRDDDEDDADDDDQRSLVASRPQSAGQSAAEGPADFEEFCSRQECDCKSASMYDSVYAAFPYEPDSVSTVWAEFFPHLPRYDPSPVQDDYYLSDKILLPFVARTQGELKVSRDTSRRPSSLIKPDFRQDIIKDSKGNIDIMLSNVGVIHGHLSPTSASASLALPIRASTNQGQILP